MATTKKTTRAATRHKATVRKAVAKNNIVPTAKPTKKPSGRLRVMATVKNGVPNNVIDLIPDTVQERRIFIRKQLDYLKGTEIECPAIGGIKVRIEGKTLDETAENACVTKKSTIAALNFEDIVKHGKYYITNLPDSKTQKGKFGAAFMIHIRAMLFNCGIAYARIAATEHNGILYYSVTIPK